MKRTHTITDKEDTHNKNTWPRATGNTTVETDSPWASVWNFFPNSGGQSKGVVLSVYIVLIILIAYVLCMLLSDFQCERENKKQVIGPHM